MVLKNCRRERNKKTPSFFVKPINRLVEIEEVTLNTLLISQDLRLDQIPAVNLAGFSTGRPTLLLSIIGPVAVVSMGQFPPPLSIRSNLI